MKKFKHTLGVIFLAVVALMSFSCEKDVEDKVAPSVEEQKMADVTFTFNNPSAFAKGNNGASISSDDLPICYDSIPSRIMILLDGFDESEPKQYFLDLIPVDEGRQTVVMKLEADKTYTIKKFEVQTANGTTIMASPLEGSKYDVLYGFENNVEKEFTVKPFEKNKTSIDVLCWRSGDFLNFGYKWLEYEQYEIKTLRFFGDFCTKFYEDWHVSTNVNPYYGQEYDGYDFPAIFEVQILKDGEVINTESNLAWKGVGKPLTIEYLDRKSIPNEQFTALIVMYKFDGTKSVIAEIDFTDNDWSEIGVNSWGGDDAVFDFVIGNCGNSDADLELPSYLPMPESAYLTFDASEKFPSAVGANLLGGYSKITVSDVKGDSTSEIFEGSIHPGWCLDYQAPITNGEFKFYSSLDNNSLPEELKGLNWEGINWILNNIEKLKYQHNTKFGTLDPNVTSKIIQAVIWKFTSNTYGGSLTQFEANGEKAKAVVELFNKVKNIKYKPPVGGYALVLAAPVKKGTKGYPQIFGIRIDP